MKRGSTIYRVKFKHPPIDGDGRTEFFFSSLAAIYELFTPEQIGCAVNRLYNLNLSDGACYDGRLCEIARESVHAKAQKKPTERVKSSQ